METKQFGYNAGTAAPHHQGQVYCETTGKTVAVTYDDETGGNARLFAAAPDLLRALQDAVSSIEYAAMTLEAPRKCAMRENIANARAAIAKAKGES